MIAPVKYLEKTLGTWDTYNTKYKKKIINFKAFKKKSCRNSMKNPPRIYSI